MESEQNSILDVLITGDSVSEGYNAAALTDTPGLMNNGYVGLLQTHLNSTYNNVGRGFMPSGYPHTPPTVPYTTLTGAGWAENYIGFMRTGEASSTAGSTASFNFNGTGLEIWTRKDPSGASIDISIDSEAADTYSLIGIDSIYKIEISGLDSGDHTCLITQNDNGLFNFTGWQELKGTYGIKVHRGIRSGGQSSWLTNQNSIDYTNSLNPDLNIIAIGVNDCISQVNPATFRSNLETYIDAVGGDIILTTIMNDDQPRSTYQYNEYADEIRDLSSDENIPLVDFDNRWLGPTNTRLTGFYSGTGNIHPGAIGHYDIYKVLKDVIL